MLKRLGRFLSSSFLKLSLFLLALTGAGWMTFGTPNAIKQATDDSNIYQATVDTILESAKQSAKDQSTQLPIDQPEIEQAARDAFPADLLSKNSTVIVDSVYGWLQGKTDQPTFSVDLTEAKQNFANGVADYAVRRYESLPPCTVAQLRTLNTEVDPFKVECRPPGLVSASVRQEVLDKILASPEFLADTSFTAADLPKDEQGRTVTENLSRAPDAYSLMRSLPWLLTALVIVLGLGVLYLSDTKRQGLRSIGITLLGTGLFLGIGALLITWSFDQMNHQPKESFNDSLVRAATSLMTTFNENLLKFYVSYIVMGIIILANLWYQNRNQARSVTTKKS